MRSYRLSVQKTLVDMRLLYTLTLLLLSTFVSQAQIANTAVDYLNAFNQEFAELQDMQIEYSSFKAHLGSEVAEQKRQALLTRAQATKTRFESITPYNNDKGIQKNALKVVDEMLQLGNTDYEAQAVAKTKCQECFATVLLQSELIDKSAQQLSKAMSNMIKSMEQFAKDNDITIADEGDDHETLLGKIGRINNYLSDMNLATLEVQYADAAIIEALNNKDIPLAQKQVKALLKAANNASRRLKQLDRIKEDATAIYQAERLVDYYKKAAQDLYPNMLTAFDKKGNINNNKVDLYNKTIATLSKNINTITNKYMNAKLNLQQRHIPKPKAKVART